MEPILVRSLTYDQLDNIFYFIRKSIIELRSQNIHKDFIRILMPETVKEFLHMNYRRPVDFSSTTLDQYLENKLLDIEVLPHYKNEIVVYSIKWDFYKEKIEPKIFLFDYTVNRKEN